MVCMLHVQGVCDQIYSLIFNLEVVKYFSITCHHTQRHRINWSRFLFFFNFFTQKLQNLDPCSTLSLWAMKGRNLVKHSVTRF
jgi:hypothetical protein